MDPKVRHLKKKKKKKQTARPGSTRENYTTQNTRIYVSKTKYIVIYSNECTIDYNQQCHPLHLGNEQYKQFPKNRKNLKKEKERGKERKRECEREGKREGKGEERREREEERVRTRRKTRRKRRRNKRKRKKIRNNRRK